MKLKQHFNLDLARGGCKPMAVAVQGEANTRVLVVSLFDNGTQWSAPAGTTAAVAFRKPDGKAGLYDTLPDGDPAAVITGNTVEATLAPQALTTSGRVSVSIVFYDAEGDTLATFPFWLIVEPNPAAGEQISNDYYKITSMAELNAAFDAKVRDLERRVASGEFTGPPGPEGPKGADGTMSFAALTEEQRESLRGPQGIQGERGETGPQGPQGETGPKGADGTVSFEDLTEEQRESLRGPQGPQGEKGETGATGAQGPQGEKGNTGAQGPQGERGADGTGVTILGSYETEAALNAAHPNGTAGESYLVAGNLHVWSVTTNKWENVGSIQGPQGERGEAGPRGIQGERGEAGPAGSTGATGPQGPQGPQGIAGYTPQKYVDYFTNEDQEEMLGRVVQTLPKYIPAVLTEEFCGDTLPPAGTPGRVFFLKKGG